MGRGQGRARRLVSLRHRGSSYWTKAWSLARGPQSFPGTHRVYLAVPGVRAVDPGTPARGSVRVQLASCRRPTCSSWRPRFPGSVAERAAAPAEMPGKKARKNAQPSPTRAQAGTDPLGPAKTQAGRCRGRGGGLGQGGLSPSGLGHRLRRGSRSGQVCALARALGAPPESSSGVFPRTAGTAGTAGTARDQAGFGIGMQLHFTRDKKLVSSSPLALPRGHEEQVQV